MWKDETWYYMFLTLNCGKNLFHGVLNSNMHYIDLFC